MRIVADENIPCVREAFSPLGEVRLMPGRAMTRAALQDADLLLVRSVTPVDEKLLKGTPVRFVGTATIGDDHIDLAYLQQQGIAFTNAAGSNANSVAEYVTAAMVHRAVQRHLSLHHLTLGIVGVGHIGSRVAEMAAGLGMRVLLNDPPLARQTRDPKFLPLEALMAADIITLHTPLTGEGEDATFHLFDESRLGALKSGSLVINTSRGAVVDNAALKKMLQQGRLTAILDVWENEPEIDAALLQLVEIGTPHIAGYSLEGKLNGVAQIYRAVCEFLGATPKWRMQTALPPVDAPLIRVQSNFESSEKKLEALIKHAYDITADDRRLRKYLREQAQDRGRYFDRLRRDYPVRREFYNYQVNVESGDENLLPPIKALGFQIRAGSS
ncbi:MAG: 4-phosphoerythronate dehydrogenase PdxB [candidate division KSB1 bacterium]|nr:4-phosphoerythronate dehydrogenase PdxB [candidate division KSB1 bacterium]MDZ7368427.1 4-phosphoerythronate dehydrogenase PdxB [candidate division KSB1 bacterium]MDZ7405997.1 4-phosphoerythronate dehydrogenase PdxB [candidate division KSB1 bacterium]